MDAAPADAQEDPRAALLGVYESALPQVYGYLRRRCSGREIAEELTSETFLAAADAVRKKPAPHIDVPWLIGVARHKLVDHWRRRIREERGMAAVTAVRSSTAEDPWEARLDALRAGQTLQQLAPAHRVALTLRYFDDLPVAQVAALLDRTMHATEALLVRARIAFRAEYSATDGEEDDRA